MVRAFAALPLPAGHRDQLAGFLEACRAAAPEFRWVAAEGLHLTLRFAGNLEEAVAARLAQRLHDIRHPPFNVRVGELGTFGRPSTVVFAQLVEGHDEAAALAGECERACVDVGLEPERRPFRPHVTLARARERRGARLPDLPAIPDLPHWMAEEFVLYRSQLGGGRPPVYTPIERYALK